MLDKQEQVESMMTDSDDEIMATMESILNDEVNCQQCLIDIEDGEGSTYPYQGMHIIHKSCVGALKCLDRMCLKKGNEKSRRESPPPKTRSLLSTAAWWTALRQISHILVQVRHALEFLTSSRCCSKMKARSGTNEN